MDATRPADDTVTERFRAVRARVDVAAGDAGRDPAEVTLVAVSKTYPAEAIEPLLAAGHRTFGENRVQEAAGKWPALRARWPGVDLHLIGPLQTNKLGAALDLFDVIETLDRPRLAEALAKEKARGARLPRLYAQINTGREPQKAGVAPEEADGFLRFCARDCGLEVAGLMAIPPADEPASPHFALLAQIARRNGLPILSMGMSADFTLAIELGATHVRVGSAIFGARTDR